MVLEFLSALYLSDGSMQKIRCRVLVSVVMSGIDLASHRNGTRSSDGYGIHMHIPTWHSIETATPI